YAIDCALAAHDRGLKTVAVTAGYITPQARHDFFAHMDAANVDLKAFTQTFYQNICFANLAPVLDTLIWLKHETEVWFEVTTLLIPGQNDSVDEVARLCDWFVTNLGAEVPLHFTAFHPDFKMMNVPHTPPATLHRARQQALAAGLHHVYTGNVHDLAGQSTYCPACGGIVIERNWFELGRWHLTPTGHCQACGTMIPGKFDPRPGQWGARRLRVSIPS
ncbi:MAG TPA: AmmeMemoRadiSam system radical SAM enzyme, partial [Anaerolineales bacterium]|nr:AmmeMemoRadiSam system radical SAM enzyme [Anaerolineales bacterium]